MKLKVYLLVLNVILIIGCSSDNNEEPQTPDPKGSLEVTVITSDGEAIEGAVVTTTPTTQQLTTGPTGKVLFENLDIGNYEVSVLVPFELEPIEEVVSIEADKTAEVLILGLDVIEPTPIDLSFLITQTYNLLKGDFLFDAGGFGLYWGDIGTDLAYVNPGNFTVFNDLDTYNFTAGNNTVLKVWADHYKAIRMVNLGLDAIEDDNYNKDQPINEGVAAAQFRFLRALLYFNLVKIYGNPVVVTTAKIDLQNPPTAIQGMDETYQLIENDLIFAEANLEANAPSNRASVPVAQALLGKVYLQMAGFPLLQNDKYALALAQFNKLTGVFGLETNYADIFSLTNETSTTEVIFRIDFDANDINTSGNYGVLWGPQGISIHDYLLLAPGFPESFFEIPANIVSPVTFPLDIEDSRFAQNIAAFTLDNGNAANATEISDWRPYKFRKDTALPVVANGESFDLPYLRYADVLLMLAEAENAINGPTAIAYEAVNQVRRRAFGDNLNDLPAGLSQQEFLEAILKERSLELCFEGHRKDDLVRTQQLQSVVESFNLSNPQNTKNYEPHKYIWPIPQEELNFNQGATQNPGY
ncbi:RagB/SusD family nutrient uptake outer membrane protein [Spongiimicrobium sp. 3-5]|uniref:RagB/SusD family nutrient uptake outer membrane protein n=1 Tax=Spongiimicrobium sp. 3-5 TaxID=3332596 RepID=UPI00397F9603